MKILYVVAGALLNGRNEVLLSSRPEGKEFAGFWEFPGGKVEKGETPEAALCRELAEELSLRVSEKDLTAIGFVSYPYKKFHLVMLLYACRRWRGRPIPLENQKTAFVGVDDLTVEKDEIASDGGRKYRLPPADGALTESLKKYLTF